MTATSFDDAWNDSPYSRPISGAVPEQQKKTNCASAKQARTNRIDREEEERQEKEDTTTTPTVTYRHEDVLLQNEVLAGILHKLEQTRQEENKRTTVFVVVGCILFALLFIYIDRLQQQIRMLNTFLCHREIPTIASVPQDVLRRGIGQSTLW